MTLEGGAPVRVAVSTRNLLRNGSFEKWFAGTTTFPSGWAAGSVPAPNVAREGTIKLLDSYSLRVEGAGAFRAVQQEFLGDILTYLQGKVVTLGCWVKPGVASVMNVIEVDDNVGTTFAVSDGTLNWQWVTVSQAIDAAATYVRARVMTAGAVGAGVYNYFDGAILVEGSFVNRWAPHPADTDHVIVLTAGGAILPTAVPTPATRTTVDGTNHAYMVVDFANGADQNAFWNFALPDNFDGAEPMLVTYHWISTVNSGTVKWQTGSRGAGSSQAWDAALGALATVTPTTDATIGDLNVTTVAFPAASHGLAAGQEVTVRARRQSAAAGDTMAAAARLLAVRLDYMATR